MSPNVGLRRRRRIAPVRYTVSGRESTGSTPTWAGDERGIRLRCICLGDAALRGSRMSRTSYRVGVLRGEYRVNYISATPPPNIMTAARGHRLRSTT